MINQEFTFAVAPMMDWTDRHYRAFMRLLTVKTLLYTEMVTAAAILHGDRDRLLGFGAQEHPLALQLGGADPSMLAEAAQIGESYGYNEINLNVGCPSDRVQSGRFGAALMREPALVATCVNNMQRAVHIPVTVKCRIGVDDQNAEETLPAFIKTVADAGCKTVIIHARKAWLQGLSPKENREVPPLQYELVRKMKKEFPELGIHLNGGLTEISQALEQSSMLDGAMIGRAAYHDPWQFACADSTVFGMADPVKTREQVVDGLTDYAKMAIAHGARLHDITRHVLGLYAGQPGARMWRRLLSEQGPKPGAGPEVLSQALQAVREYA